MRHLSFLIALLVAVLVSTSCGGTSTVPRSPASETSNNETSTTQSDADTRAPESDTVVTGPTTTSVVIDGSAPTTDPNDADAGASDENPERSETNENQTTSTTSPSAPSTTYGIVTEEPANVFSGGVETWEPDA